MSLKAPFDWLGLGMGAVAARLRQHTARPPRFRGAYPSYARALAARRHGALAYDDEAAAAINLAEMARLAVWDYPVLFWLQQSLKPGARVLDAGGHFATKYMAFQDYLPLGEVAWTVYDLPGTIAAAEAAQAAGGVPAAVRFCDDLGRAGAADILLASGLLQYLGVPLTAFVDQMAARPPRILLNKVALTEDATRVTLERIGPAEVPYQIRNRADFEAEIAALGYQVDDSWTIPSLAHQIPTHPWLGRSESRGYALTAAETF